MLNKKLYRDIKKNLSQFITIFLMVFIGVMAYSGIEAYMLGMTKSADKFYTENNLEDLNVTGYFTKEDITKLKNIDHVKNAELKLSITGSTNNDKTLLLNFIDTNEISKLYVLDGDNYDQKSGVWLDSFYGSLNHLKVGDTITIKYNNTTLEEKIRGFINVPDHIYDVKDASELYPNHTDFGFAYLSISELKDEITYNSIMVDVDQKENVNQVKNNILEEIPNALMVTKIEDTASYSKYQGEIDEGKTYVGVFSGLFIFIAMLSVLTTMNRIIKKERPIIGTLKALGFKDKKIARHYISYGFIISLIASIAGLIAGYFLIGKFFIKLEMSFFMVPNGTPVMSYKSYLVALLVIFLICLVTYLACFKELHRTAASILRNDGPKVKTSSLNITTKGIFKKLSFTTIWCTRDIFRNKARTIMGISGITGCAMLIVCAFGMLDSMNHFVDLQFSTLYNFDYKLSVDNTIDTKELDNLMTTYGKDTSASYLIEIKNNKELDANNILVYDAGDKLRFVDNKENFIKLDNNDGVYITYKLANTLNKKIGDKIEWRLMGKKEYYTSTIVGFNKDPQNQNMTMTKAYFESLENTYKPDSIYTNKDLSKEKEIPNITLIQNIDSLKSSIESMLSTMKSMIILIIGIAIILGIVIIYNMSILSYTEKTIEFATLKVLGFKDEKINKVFMGHNLIITAVAIILGIPAGYYLTDWLFQKAIDETYDFKAFITVPSYIYAIVGTFLISYLVSLYLTKKIKKIDMVTSLKGNE